MTTRSDPDAPATAGPGEGGNTDATIIALPARPPGSRNRKRRKARKKPLYRRPVLMSFLTVLALVIGVGAYGLFRLESTVNAIHQVSTVPPQVSDNTYVDADDATPTDLITTRIDTDPARTAVAESDLGNRFRSPQGVTGRIASAADNTGAIAAGALQASGVTSAKGEPMTILLMGVDARPGSAIDFGVRPDSLMVLRLDPVENSCRILSIPRDTRVELPGYGESKINHALMVGGIPYQLLVTQDYLGISIDHYFLIDFTAFETVVDAVGGISVNVPAELTKNGNVVYTKGTHDFDGKEALAFARFRSTSSDGDATRVERHWAILSALANATKNSSLAKEVNSILPQIDSHIRTDMSVSQMLELADSYGGACRNINGSEIAKMDGTRVKMSDPILGHTDYFNVVSEPIRKQRVADLMGSATPPPSPEGTPVSTVATPASPEASPAASPTSTAAATPESSSPRASPSSRSQAGPEPDPASTPRPTPTPVSVREAS
ncbi:MAG: LCP family protein [Thermomicrobiales bacterium]